ncbi:MAG: molybdopterin molybdenumtransferase MoeA [Rhodobacteraceae bacterium]|nr:molybdopterin molybdenumtransferase MoeA [Paracoccaceae bacterium]
MNASRSPLPPLRDERFALPAGVHWTPVETAHRVLRERLQCVMASETLPVAQASGRILAAAVHALRAHPPCANAAVDGFGFAHAAVGAGQQALPLVAGGAAAGAPYKGKVPPGHAIRILTGAQLPEGVDTILPQEDVSHSAGKITFREPVKPHANTRKGGEDVAAGAALLPAARRITPADIALLTAAGVPIVPVRKQLRVAVISTGNELAAPKPPASPHQIHAHQIYDANRPMLLALLAQVGCVPVDMGQEPDDRDTLRARLDHASSQVDAIVTSGGVSAGDEDHVAALLTDHDQHALWRIAIKPGRPLVLARWNTTPIFGLPGNPVAAMLCSLIFVRPALGLLAGEGWHLPAPLLLPAAFEKRKKPGRREYLRARVRSSQVEVFPFEGSGRISGLSWAEGVVELLEGTTEITRGTPVRYLPHSAFGLGGC